MAPSPGMSLWHGSGSCPQPPPLSALAGIQLSPFILLLLPTVMRDPKGQILPLGTSLVLPWLHTGMFNPLPAAFQAVLLLTRKAPNTFPSHGGVVGPQPGSTDFPNWKKKWDAGRRGQGWGCIFLVFFLGLDSSSSAHQMEKGSQSTSCVPGQAPAAGLAATGANWGSFSLVQREWRGPRHPELEWEHPACCRHGGPGTGVLWSGSA